MSADDGVFIARFPEGFRVTHGFAVDNLKYYEKGTLEEREEWETFFNVNDLNKPVFKDRDDAFEFAKHLENAIAAGEWLGIGTEYGVVYLGACPWLDD